MGSLMCNYSWMLSVQNLSTECVKDGICSTDESLCECYPFEEPISMMAGIWCIINGVIGFMGNCLTLLAIPYAKRHKKFGFCRKWDATTLFILNLAFSDTLYCTVNLPLYATQYLYQNWPFSKIACQIFGIIRYVNAFGDWMSLAFIAISRCIGMLKPEFSRLYMSGKNGVIVIALIWMYAVVLVLPEATGAYGTIGYNCRTGKCDFIMGEDNKVDPHVVCYGIGFSVPFAIILICYGKIWYHVTASTKSISNHGYSQGTIQRLNERDLRMTWTILLVCFCYMLFVMPIALLNMIDPNAANGTLNLNLIFFCIYWCQYSLNFVVYAFRSEQYRKAYFHFLCMLMSSLCSLCKPSKEEILFQSRRVYRITTNEGHCSEQIQTISLSVEGNRGKIQLDSSDNCSSLMINAKRSKNLVFNIKTENSQFQFLQLDSEDNKKL